MSEREPVAMEIEIAGNSYSLLRNCAVILFRQHVEVSYIAVNDEDRGELARGFNRPDLCNWMAGYAIVPDEDGELHRHTTLYQDETFRSAFGWSPIVIEKESPSETEMEAFMDVNAGSIDEEWRELGE